MVEKQCYKCGATGLKLYSTFGKYICKPCLNERKKNSSVERGHSGMIYSPTVAEKDYRLSGGDNISLLRVQKSHPLYVKWFFDHYPESRGIVGRQLNYLIYNDDLPIGLIGFASPPLNYKKFNQFFDLNESKKSSENAKLFVNNNAFRIVHSEKNFGTQILSLARKQTYVDYYESYGDVLLGLVTFVEPPRDGALYKADNWTLIGETEGVEVKRRGEGWTEKQYSRGMKKLIYGYKYPKKFRRKLPLDKIEKV